MTKINIWIMYHESSEEEKVASNQVLGIKIKVKLDLED